MRLPRFLSPTLWRDRIFPYVPFLRSWHANMLKRERGEETEGAFHDVKNIVLGTSDEDEETKKEEV